MRKLSFLTSLAAFLGVVLSANSYADGAFCTVDQDCAAYDGNECSNNVCKSCGEESYCVQTGTRQVCVRTENVCDDQGRNCYRDCAEYRNESYCAQSATRIVCEPVGPNTGPIINEENQDVRITVTNSSANLIVDVKLDKLAKPIFDQMTGKTVQETQSDEGFRREVAHGTNDSQQALKFNCTRDSSNQHSCRLFIKNFRKPAGETQYFSDFGQNDSSLYFVRTNTDFYAAAKKIYEAFPNAASRQLNNYIEDAQIGETTVGGREIRIPEESGPFQIICRGRGSEYFCKFVTQRPSRHPGSIVETDSIRMETTDNAIKIQLKDNVDAKYLFEKFVAPKTDLPDRITKTLDVEKEPGKQRLSFSCSKINSNNKYDCQLTLLNNGDAKPVFRTHVAKDNNANFVVRNDSEDLAISKKIFEAFPSAAEYSETVNASIDQETGLRLFEGDEYVIPDSQDSSFKLKCRKGGQKYFCKFLINWK